MDEIKELQSLTTHRGVYNSFPDKYAREQIEELKKNGNGSGQNVTYKGTVDINIKKWFGKKIVVDGSSITAGGTGLTQPTWPSFIADMFALDVYSHAESGTGWFTGATTALQRVDEYEADADAVIMMGDYNGIYAYTSDKGNIEDAADASGSCYAKLKYLAEKLINKYPLCPIIWVIEPPRAKFDEANWEMVPMNPNSAYNAYAKVIEEVAELYGFSHCNLMQNTVFRPWIKANFEATTSDGTHPWNNIQRTMAQVIAEAMKRTPLIYNESYVVTPDDSSDGGASDDDSEKIVTALSVTLNGEIFESDTLKTVRNCLTVKATYDDLSVATVTDYELSGELVAGTSTLTVSYGGVTTTKDVTVTAGQRTTTIELLDQNVTEGYYLFASSGNPSSLADYGYTDYISVKGGQTIAFGNSGEVQGLNCGFVEYDNQKEVVQTVDTAYGTLEYTLAENTAYIRCNVRIGASNTLTYVPG